MNRQKLLLGLGIPAVLVFGLALTCAVNARTTAEKERAAVENSHAGLSKSDEGGFKTTAMFRQASSPAANLLPIAEEKLSLRRELSQLQFEQAQTEEKPSAIQGRKLIRSGALSLRVKNCQKAAIELQRIVESAGGYIAESSITKGSSGEIRGLFTVKVPSMKLEASGKALRSLGEVHLDETKIEDVTKAYSELELRIKLKREAQLRVQGLLRDRAAKLADILAAEKELERLTEEIESLERQRRGLDHQIDLATLQVELSERDFAFGRSAWSPLTEAFKDSGRTLAATLAFLLYFTLAVFPWVLVATGLFYLIRRIMRATKSSSTETKTEPSPHA